MLYFSHETYKEARQIHEESQALFAKADSLMSIPAAKSVARTGSKAASFFDELFTDFEKDYQAPKKASAKQPFRLIST